MCQVLLCCWVSSGYALIPNFPIHLNSILLNSVEISVSMLMTIGLNFSLRGGIISSECCWIFTSINMTYLSISPFIQVFFGMIFIQFLRNLFQVNIDWKKNIQVKFYSRSYWAGWGAEKKILLRTLIQEIASQIPLRNCSKEVGVEASIHEINPRKILKTEGLREWG